MNSMMELMEKKTPLTKKNDKKKGMTLVEVMAAMAILSILFMGISSFMINVVKSENRSNKYLDTTNYLKSALDTFKLKSGGDITDSTDTRQYYITNDNFNKYINKTCYLYFDNMSEMLNKIINPTDNIFTQKSEYATKYELKIKVSDKVEGKNLYLIEAEMAYTNGGRSEINEKKIYVNR